MSACYQPKPEHKFSLGLWIVGNIGSDPFGEAVHDSLSPVQIVHLLAEVGACGVNFHDNDLVPIDALSPSGIRSWLTSKKALDETDIVVSMATTDLFSDPAFRDGAFSQQRSQGARLWRRRQESPAAADPGRCAECRVGDR